ncbi:LysR family transcriptional regulator [Aminobacter aganoensis]|uniref:DNA-binding transcriptional LysR family regulator n=1 Tax=Aminobacter aganoensis TaxID=83264 RepID=A0A7X0FB70_9HYPH|nr:LysR family transcriptional regulator [Aminobacter aganoensis]MBB6356209.1 DNA-binding transcriptional LysR family regulator [Aminobacter aganoensis]
MNLRQLEVFRAVMQTGSTIGASGVLSLSQSAISRQLTSLEQEIGLELFRREKGRLVPKPEATALLQEVGELSDVLARLKRRTDELSAGWSGKTLIKMGFPHSLTTTLLPGLVRDFLAAQSEVSIELVAGPYDAIERAVMGRTVDFGFVRLPTEDRGLQTMPLVSSGQLCALPVGHPLAERETVSADDLSRTDLVLLGRLRSSREDIEERLRHAQGTVRCRVETHSVESSVAMVAEGIGVSIIPALIGNLLKSDRVVMRPFSPPLWNDYGIATLRDTQLSRPVLNFIDTLRERLVGDGTMTKPIG